MNKKIFIAVDTNNVNKEKNYQRFNNKENQNWF